VRVCRRRQHGRRSLRCKRSMLVYAACSSSHRVVRALSSITADDASTGRAFGSFVRPQVWGLPGGRFKAAMTGHLNWVRSAEFSPDQRLAVSGSDDKTVKLWDITSHQCIHSWDGAHAPHTHASP
jgi:WD40 repeat protein